MASEQVLHVCDTTLSSRDMCKLHCMPYPTVHIHVHVYIVLYTGPSKNHPLELTMQSYMACGFKKRFMGHKMGHFGTR